MATIGAKTAIVKTIMILHFNQDVNPSGGVEINLNKVPPGQCVTVKWDRKPLFVKHR